MKINQKSISVPCILAATGNLIMALSKIEMQAHICFLSQPYAVRSCVREVHETIRRRTSGGPQHEAPRRTPRGGPGRSGSSGGLGLVLRPARRGTSCTPERRMALLGAISMEFSII